MDDQNSDSVNITKKLSYVNITKNVVESPEVCMDRNEILQKKGWVILSKKSDNAKILEKNKERQTLRGHDSKECTIKDWENCVLEMSNRWDQFRDEQNMLLGDRSPYINYKQELQDMVDEENSIQEEMYKIRNNISNDDSDYCSDDEHNKNLIF